MLNEINVRAEQMIHQQFCSAAFVTHRWAEQAQRNIIYNIWKYWSGEYRAAQVIDVPVAMKVFSFSFWVYLLFRKLFQTH